MSEHTPITGELRRAMERYCNFKDENIVKLTEGDFDRICDAIDAVHAALERENAELRERVAILDESADSMHDGWVRLPLDRDGEPIHIGDVMEWPTTGETFEVVGIGDGTLFYVEDGNECADWTGASTKRHHHAPTVEDVLREMHAELDEVTALYVGEAIDSDERDRDEARIFAEYAKRLTLAGDAE